MTPRRMMLVVASLGAGGTERVVAALAGAWASRGEEVTVVTLDEAPPFYRLDAAVALLGLGVARPSPHAPAALANNARTLRALRRVIRERRPDVVLSFGDTTNVACLLAAGGLPIPVLAAERCDPRFSPESRIWRALRRLTYPRASRVVVQTEAAAAVFRAGGVRRTAVIPNPAWPPPAEGPRGSSETRDPLLLGVGRLVPQKGFDLLIGAFARLAARFPDWSLVILGEGSERGALCARVAGHGLEERVQLPGVTQDPYSWYRRASLFALPSRFEGFPNALVEAMAAGLPVVAADCPSGPGEIVQQGTDGLLVPVGDREALEAALGSLMADPALRRRLGEGARRVASRLSPERVLSLWEELLPPSPVGRGDVPSVQAAATTVRPGSAARGRRG